EVFSGFRGAAGIAPSPQIGKPLALALEHGRIHSSDRDVGPLAFGTVRVDAHDDLFFALDRTLLLVGGVLDSALLIAALDPGERAPLVIDLGDLGERAALDIGGQRFDRVSTPERVDR